MLSCIRLLIVLWCSAKTRKIKLMVHYVLCLLRSEAEIVCLHHPLSPTRPPEREMGRVGEDPGNEVENALESV